MTSRRVTKGTHLLLNGLACASSFVRMRTMRRRPWSNGCGRRHGLGRASGHVRVSVHGLRRSPFRTPHHGGPHMRIRLLRLVLLAAQSMGNSAAVANVLPQAGLASACARAAGSRRAATTGLTFVSCFRCHGANASQLGQVSGCRISLVVGWLLFHIIGLLFCLMLPAPHSTRM